MIVQPADATDEQIKQLVIDWIAVVAEERYEEALAMLYQGNINPYGSERFYPGSLYSPDILRLEIASYGSLDPEIDEGRLCCITFAHRRASPHFSALPR